MCWVYHSRDDSLGQGLGSLHAVAKAGQVLRPVAVQGAVRIAAKVIKDMYETQQAADVVWDDVQHGMVLLQAVELPHCRCASYPYMPPPTLTPTPCLLHAEELVW